MSGDMESILFKGDDSSSGESDTEPQTSSGTQPKPSGTDSRPVTNTGLVPRTDASTGPMSQSEMAQRLKSMYSPASKAAGGTSSTGIVQAVVPTPQAVATQQTLPVPATTQHIQHHRPQQQVQQQQKAPNAVASYRPTSAGESAQQQQQRANVQQVSQRIGSQPQHIQQRSGGGISHQQQVAPLASSAQNPSEQQQSRPRVHQMQAPSIPHRPSNRLPQQQQSVRNVQQGQPQGSIPPIRNPPPSAPTQSLQQSSAPRSNSYGTNVSQQQQQAQLAKNMDRGMMEKKQKERFLIFTKVLMKYLESKDPPLHSKVKAIIKDCADRNRRKEAGFESVTAAMRIQLKKVVNDIYWKKAEDYLKHFLKEKAAKPGMLPNAGVAYNSGASSAPIANSISSSQEAIKRNNELQLQNQQRQPETPRGLNQDPGKNLPLIRDDQGKKRQVGVSAQAPNKNISQPKSVPSFQAGKEKSAPKSRAKGASTPTQQRKQSVSMVTTNSDVAKTVPAALVPASAPALTHVPAVGEYNELMEHVDHAYSFDMKATGSLLGESIYATMSEEQMRLLYEPKKLSGVVEKNFVTEGICFPVQGWSKRNIISSRVAWSRLRPEKKQNGSSSTNPVVAGGLLGLTQVPGKKPVTIEGNTNPDNAEVDFEWHNEDKAEADVTLAVLSEGAEIYLKSVVLKALHCARQRQNLDGIRIWHQQFTSDDGKPNLSLMLGCDVDRQIAQADGNAAMICRRMEEANKRQSNIPALNHTVNDYTLIQAKSMSDLSLRPHLENAGSTAETEGKRRYEIYGGKLHEEPPLGRLAKIAKLEVADFQSGMALSRRSRRHQAATFSSSFFF